MNKTKRSALIIKFNWLLILLVMLTHEFIEHPFSEQSTSMLSWLSMITLMWFLYSILLLIFVIPVAKSSVRGLTFMSYMLLLYFIIFVMASWAPNDLTQIIFSSLKSILTVSLFTITIMYIRWKKSDLRAELNQQGE
jgi:uncharacterized membrane protein